MTLGKELNLFPTLQRIESLGEEVKLLVEKLKQIEHAIKELKKGILNESKDHKSPMTLNDDEDE